MFHILGFLFFIILVVLVIGLLILSKVVSLVFGFKRRMQGQNSGQRTTYSSQNYQSGNRQEETTDSYSAQGPGITFRIHEARIKKMEQLLLQKEITLAWVAYATGKQNPDLEYRDFGAEYLVLALPASHPLAHLAGEESWKTLPDLDLSLLSQDYFVLPTRDTLSRELADRTFLYNNIRPKILFETGNNRTMLNMTKNQQCPVFLPQSYAQPNPDIVFFSVSPHEIWHRGVAYLKGTYLSKPEKYFIELVTNYEAEYQGQTKY